jgi:hypothetical protein
MFHNNRHNYTPYTDYALIYSYNAYIFDTHIHIHIYTYISTYDIGGCRATCFTIIDTIILIMHTNNAYIFDTGSC